MPVAFIRLISRASQAAAPEKSISCYHWHPTAFYPYKQLNK